MHAAPLIEKLTTSWQEYKKSLKHKHTDMGLADLIVHITFEEQNRQCIKNESNPLTST